MIVLSALILCSRLLSGPESGQLVTAIVMEDSNRLPWAVHSAEHLDIAPGTWVWRAQTPKARRPRGKQLGSWRFRQQKSVPNGATLHRHTDIP